MVASSFTMRSIMSPHLHNKPSIDDLDRSPEDDRDSPPQDNPTFQRFFGRSPETQSFLLSWA